ncbi:hypothetical protein ACV229_01650 [Burkholderia sp. MR1-5-21]
MILRRIDSYLTGADALASHRLFDERTRFPESAAPTREQVVDVHLRSA